MKKWKKSKKIQQQLEKKKWKHTNDVVKFANAPLNQTLIKLKVSGIGLTEDLIQKRENIQFQKHESKEHFRFFHYIFLNVKEPFTLILLAISIYNFIMFGIKNDDITYLVGGIIVIFLVSFSITFDLIAKYAMYKDNQKIKKTSKESIQVLRNIKIPNNLSAFYQDEKLLIEHLTKIDYHELLIGDLIYLKSGDIVPADAKIIYDQDGLSVDQELLTGWKNATTKKSFNSSLNPNIFLLSNIIYRGTRIVHGNCWAIVLYKGHSTYYQHLKEISIDKKEKTIFSLQTKSVTNFLITIISLFAPIIFLLALVLAGLRNGFNSPSVWIDSIIFGMTIVICLAPDSLPLSMVSAFSRTRKLLANKNIISRDISAAQNIGAMDILAIDMRKIFVNKEYILDNFVNLNNQTSKEVIKWTALSYLSNPSQTLAISNALNKEKHILKENKNLAKEFQFIRKVNFHGIPKTYISVVEDSNHQRWAILRGPKSLVLSNSNNFLDLQGKTKKINKTNLNPTIKKTFKEINKQGFWSVGIAIKKIKDADSNNEFEVLKANYTYLGIINFVQTIISGAKENLREIQKKAIGLKYMSHDPLDQTLILARDLGFKVTNYLSAEEISKMNDRELNKKISKTNVFYNLDPLTEIRIIKNFKKLGHTIGYLGQDLDDSLQLLNANIGITTHDSDVFAKQNANLIINEGNINDIDDAIVKGRQASINIVKFIKVKVVWAIAITIKLAVGLIWFNSEPMNSMELLTQNLIFDIVEFLIIFDKVDYHYIKKPVRWDTKSILPFALWNGIILQIITLINICLFIYVIEPGILSTIRHAQPGWQNNLALVQTIYWLEDTILHFLFILIMRTHYQKWFKDKPSWPLLSSICLLTLFVILVPLVPTLNNAFTLQTPTWKWWILFLGLIIGYCLLADFWKWTYVRIFNKWL